MKKLKIYLDTSVISHLLHDDTPVRQADTIKLWERIKNGNYDVYTSTVTFYEIDECAEELRVKLRQFIDEIDVTIINLADIELELAEKIIEVGILTRKSIDDCYHIACAIVSECDIIVSWNIKHLVNIRTINGVRGISQLEGYKPIDIYTPQILLGVDFDDP
ncbi:MAG: PIN domain-containing protein [Ruminococcus sp.]|jgi:predicted nucleic acid-binding protein|nr:PIN domain-containing protein [Ruminococcus sp.]